MTDEQDRPSRAQQFGQYVAAAARAAGYDIDSPRGGGKKALAAAAGMSHASVSRMLAGQTIPDTSFFEPLANALHKPVAQMLIQSGLVSEDALLKPDVLDRPLDPRAVAKQLGIRSEGGVRAFEAMVRALTDDDANYGSDERRSA
jgi:transcriptional regulator with XRE-family HTH domain